MGFTLLELLVSLAVLFVLTMVSIQVLGAVSDSLSVGQCRINNFGKARALLDLISRDIHCGLFREDIAAFPGYPDKAPAFYTCQQGIGGERNLSLVQYCINESGTQSTLQRADYPFAWSSVPAFGNTADIGSISPVARDTAPGILGFRLRFVLEDGSLSNYYSRDQSNPTRAIAVAMAVLDDQSLRQLTQSQQSTLRTLFQTVVSGTLNTQTAWDQAISKLDWSAYPRQTARGLKIYERYVDLPGYQQTASQ